MKRLDGWGGGALRAMVAGLLVLACAGSDAAAEQGPSNFPFTPLQIALLPNVQLPRHWPVWGVRVNLLYGAQDRVGGLDVGLFNEIGAELTGVGAGLVNFGEGRVRGMRIGVANTLEGDVTGFEAGLVNHTVGTLRGAQVGFTSFADKGTGLQIGFLNRAEEFRGLQLGVINLNRNGFLPFFPLFNFGF